MLNHCASYGAQVSAIGAIMEVNQKSTNTVYKLDDGTAQIDAMVWSSGEESEQQMRKKDQWTCVVLAAAAAAGLLLAAAGCC